MRVSDIERGFVLNCSCGVQSFHIVGQLGRPSNSTSHLICPLYFLINWT
jgi:hypothetical protein